MGRQGGHIYVASGYTTQSVTIISLLRK